MWFDQDEARVFFLEGGAIAEDFIGHPHHAHTRHPAEDTARFFHAVARTLDDVDAILVVGPSTAKLAFLRYLHAHEPVLEPRICGIETVAHPSDGELLEYAQHHFKLDVHPAA